MFRLLVLATTLVASLSGVEIICRCQEGKPMYPSYPGILSCMIPNSDDWVSSFVEEDDTWNPDHEFPAKQGPDCKSLGPGQWCATEDNSQGGTADPQTKDCSGGPCWRLQSAPLDATSGYWICKLFTPKCWYDPGRVEGTVWNGKYGCADNEIPQPAMAGATCQMTCQPGYQLTGGPTTCRGGQWVSFPTCDRMGCTGKPPLPNGATAWAAPCDGNGPWPSDTQCDPVCKDGWKVGGEATCRVGADGKPDWDTATCIPPPPPPSPPPPSPPTPPPQPNSPPSPPPPPPSPPPPPPPADCSTPGWAMQHGQWGCKNAPHGGSCQFTCKAGFEPAGKPPVCQNGKWDQAPPTQMHAKDKAHCKCQPFQHIGPNTPPACIFGGYSGFDRVDFIADTSGSMAAGMKVAGKAYTRIQYLKIALKDAIDSLDPDQMFNIIQYGTTCKQWQTGVVQATPANKKAGDAYVNGMVATGSTNINCGLVLAATDPKLEAAFLLTDGEPTVKLSSICDWKSKPAAENAKDPYATIRSLMDRDCWRNSIVVNPISFFAPATRYKDLDWLAAKTGGKHLTIK